MLVIGRFLDTSPPFDPLMVGQPALYTFALSRDKLGAALERNLGAVVGANIVADRTESLGDSSDYSILCSALADGHDSHLCLERARYFQTYGRLFAGDIQCPQLSPKIDVLPKESC